MLSSYLSGCHPPPPNLLLQSGGTPPQNNTKCVKSEAPTGEPTLASLQPDPALATQAAVELRRMDWFESPTSVGGKRQPTKTKYNWQLRSFCCLRYQAHCQAQRPGTSLYAPMRNACHRLAACALPGISCWELVGRAHTYFSVETVFSTACGSFSHKPFQRLFMVDVHVSNWGCPCMDLCGIVQQMSTHTSI